MYICIAYINHRPSLSSPSDQLKHYLHIYPSLSVHKQLIQTILEGQPVHKFIQLYRPFLKNGLDQRTVTLYIYLSILTYILSIYPSVYTNSESEPFSRHKFYHFVSPQSSKKGGLFCLPHPSPNQLSPIFERYFFQKAQPTQG